MIRETFGDAAMATELGPNVRKLIELPLTVDAAARHDMTPEEFVMWNIAMVKRMAGNPYGDDDETIAVALMEGIEFWRTFLQMSKFLEGIGM